MLEAQTSMLGRPRDPKAEQAILSAAAALIRQRGFTSVTTAEIAAKAGVGKQTIYRRWPSKFELALAVLRRTAEESVTSDGSLDEFFRDLLKSARDNAELLRAVMAQSQSEPNGRKLISNALIEPRRDALRALIEQQFSNGKSEITILACYGAIWYRLLLDEPLDDDFAHMLSSMALRLNR
jgi:AcrR family transcriptional regulator